MQGRWQPAGPLVPVHPQRNLDLWGAGGDVFGVKILPLGKFVLTLCVFVAMTAPVWAHDDKPEIVPLGNDTYSIRCEGRNAFMRDEDKLRAEVNDAAVKFCADNGKVLKVISVNSKVPMFSTGYAWAKITFKALNPGSPELMPAPAVIVAPASPAERVLSTDELYSELTKLDDLRKKGILTDEEFQEEKKKVLSHSK